MAPGVLVAATGKDAELHDRVPITKGPGQGKRVVLSMASGGGSFSALPSLKPGDRLAVLAELEVTTDCPRPGAGCVGKPYAFAPTVDARLLLASSSKATDAGARALAVGKPERQQVTQERHHHVFVFPDAELRVPRRGLPWSGRSHLNLVLSAYHPSASSGQVLLVGQNEPNGTVEQNQGRLNVVRFRSAAPSDAATARTAHRRSRKVPVRKGERTVVYSLLLSNLRKDEQLVVSAELPTSARGLGYEARISTELVLTADHTDTKSGRGMKALGSLRGEITKFNGFNCLPGAASCLTRKVGVVRILHSRRRDAHVNLVAVSASPTHEDKPGDALQVIAGGSLRVDRFRPGLLG
jgi:hypothetical protein